MTDKKVTTIRKNKKEYTIEEKIRLINARYRADKEKSAEEPDCINSGGFHELEEYEGELRRKKKDEKND